VLISFPSSHPLATAHLVPPISFLGTAGSISTGHLQHHPFVQVLSLLLPVYLLLENGNATAFRIPTHPFFPIRTRDTHTAQVLSTPGLLMNPKGDEQVTRKSPTIKHSAGNNNHSHIQMNTS